MLDIREEKNGVSFKVRVQPRAAKNQVAGLYEGALKIRLTAPPVDGEANEACRAFLAGLLGVTRSQVEIVSGHTGRNKLIRVEGITAERLSGLLKL
ncbi:MAG: DUF167 domain-containing protein [Firmicutes bacterium]|nr:DUF167 domain-containing protein [Bacillota bacterium]